MWVKSLEITAVVKLSNYACVCFCQDILRLEPNPLCFERVSLVNNNFMPFSPVKRVGITLTTRGISWHRQFKMQSHKDFATEGCDKHIVTLAVTGVCEWGGSRGLRSSVLPTTIIKIVWGGSAWASEGLSGEARKSPNAVLCSLCDYALHIPAE